MIKEYMKRMELGGHSPNFFCSPSFFEASGLEVSELGSSIGVFDEEGLFLPTLSPMGEITDGNSFYSFLSKKGKERNLIYDPCMFLDLSGGRWRDTRKNLKWAKEDTGEAEFHLSDDFSPLDVEYILSLDRLAVDDLYDPDAVVNCIMNYDTKKLIKGSSGKTYGIVIWDENYKYVNFRYCWVESGIRGLSDTARVLFYWFMASRSIIKLVNDGGDLGNPGLLRYKMRLNPCQILYM